jgi:hypothetical protein
MSVHNSWGFSVIVSTFLTKFVQIGLPSWSYATNRLTWLDIWLRLFSSQTFSLINTRTFLKPSHSSHLPAYEDGTYRVFRNVGIQNSDAGELPSRKHKTFRTRRKFEIKNFLLCFNTPVLKHLKIIKFWSKHVVFEMIIKGCVGRKYDCLWNYMYKIGWLTRNCIRLCSKTKSQLKFSAHITAYSGCKQLYVEKRANYKLNLTIYYAYSLQICRNKFVEF